MKPVPSLSRAFELRNTLEKHFLEFAGVLYKIREGREWEGRYGTFREFLQDLKVQESTASRLISVYRTYVVEHRLSRGKLVKAGWSNLYTAIPLLSQGKAEDVVERAALLRRQDLEEEVRGEFECDHEEKITICAKCHKRIL